MADNMVVLFLIAELLRKLASGQESDFAKNHKRSASILKDLESEMKRIRYLVTHHGIMNLEKLEDVVYDAEDLEDEIAYEAMRWKTEVESRNLKSLASSGFMSIPTSVKRYGQGLNSNIKAMGPITKLRTARIVKGMTKRADGIIEVSPKSAKTLATSVKRYGQGMNSNIKAMRPTTKLRTERIVKVMKNRADGIIEVSPKSPKTLGGTSPLPIRFSGYQRSSTSFLPDETPIYGREEDRSSVIRFLLSGEENVDAIAILGMGGCGKTTLAQLVYNDERVLHHFPVRAWLDVSEHFDVLEITRKIVRAATLELSESKDPYLLESRLCESLAGERFLIVLDDVWEEDSDKWKDLTKILKSGARGSRIIITTRSRYVAIATGCSTHHHLDILTDDRCWSVFAGPAFAGRDGSEVATLEDIGKKIVNKCYGIPWVARSIGELLRSKRTPEEWLHVLKALDSKPLEIEGSYAFLSNLRLSYDRLPIHLKRCFAYCSLLPRDYEFQKEELILLWMAQGFVKEPIGLSMEARVEPFDGLLERSFFVQAGDLHFKMHNLLHDLATIVSGRVCFRLAPNKTNNSAIPERTRHLSLVLDQYDTLEKLKGILKAKSLRTFFLISPPSDHKSCRLSSQALEVILVRQRRLRVLSSPHYQDAELPPSIGNLKHLRYLNFSHSELEKLPESLCILCNLQTLILANCYRLRTLPKGTVKLVNLQHLNIENTGLQQMPEKMGKLTSLQTLSNFIVGLGGSSIKELGALLNLHGRLSVSELQNVSSGSDAADAKVEAMEYLNELCLEWSIKKETPLPDLEREVLDNLKPPVELQKLSILGYGGQEFPKWLGEYSSLSKLSSLHLSDCSSCTYLPPLGRLPLIEHLVIERISAVRSIGHEFYGMDESFCKPFQSLKTLRFEEMSQWERWTPLEVEGEEFPCLKELSVIKCPELKGDLPKSLPALTILQISECPTLLYKVQNRASDKRSDVKISGITEITQQDDDRMKILPSKDGQQQSSSLTIEPEDDGRTKILSSEYEKQHFTSSSALKVQDDDEMVSLSGKEGKQHSSLPSSSMHPDDDSINPLSSKDEQHPSFSGEMRQDEDYNQRKSLSSKDGNEQFSSSLSMNVSSIGEKEFKELPTDLHSLRIESYASEKIPTGKMERTSLQHLYIIDSVSLKIFPLSPSLKTLYIHNCKNLNSPPNKAMNQEAQLEHLCLGSCDSLHSFPLNYFPKLKALSLWNCRNLECLSIEKEFQRNLTSLDALEIKDCPTLRYLSEEEFQAPNLTSLVLFNCESLELLPRMQSLKSLQSLHISKCPALKSLPAEGLPSSLIILCISFCDNITPQVEWKLAELHSLSHFEIEGGCKQMESFPKKGLLPTNLNSLRISRLSNLKCLEAMGLPTSLKTLEIYGCNELNSLPEDGLPSSLSSLSIRDCSLLNPKLQKRKGREWFMIARIPPIHLDDEDDEVSDW